MLTIRQKTKWRVGSEKENVKTEIEQFEQSEELSGDLGYGSSLMKSVLENDKEKIEQGQLIEDSVNQGLGGMTSDLFMEKFVTNYTLAKKIFGESLIRKISGYDSSYIEKNIKVLELESGVKVIVGENYLDNLNDYDLIILDVMLPSMDGFEVCKKIREMGLKMPILMLTAKSMPEEKVAGLDQGADDYLVKPFELNELIARIRALGRRSASLTPNKLMVGDLVLDTGSHEVLRNNTPIQLTGKEYRILEYLMRNSGQVLSKDKIISHVWDFDTDILPNTVEVYIGYLRSKIDRPFKGSPLIHTLRGFGYRLGGDTNQ